MSFTYHIMSETVMNYVSNSNAVYSEVKIYI